MTNAKEQTITYKYYNDSNNNQVVEQNTNLENGKISKTVLLYGSETGYAFPKSENEIVYTYDLRGNRKTSNNSNDVSNIQNTSYSYDLENKLKSVTKGTNTTAMTYYADGYRAKKTTSTNSTSYIYNLAGKVVSTETAKNGSTTRDNYVWGPDRDHMIIKIHIVKLTPIIILIFINTQY